MLPGGRGVYSQAIVISLMGERGHKSQKIKGLIRFHHDNNETNIIELTRGGILETTPLECSCSLLVETRARVFLFILVTTTRNWIQDSRYIENLMQFFHGIRTQSFRFANRVHVFT